MVGRSSHLTRNLLPGSQGRQVIALRRSSQIEAMQKLWLQCEGTWFVGVDALPNDPAGRLGDSVPLAGTAVDFIIQNFGRLPALHPAQVSVIYPGYPKPRAQETPAAFRFRQTRDAAHIDGILPQGPDRRRNLIEPHAFVLGLPLNHTSPGASPLVVWPDSPAIVRRHLAAAFASNACRAMAGCRCDRTIRCSPRRSVCYLRTP